MCRKTDARRPEFDTPPLDQLIGALAAAHHGVIAGRQLSALGLGPRAAAHRAVAGRLHRVHHGVYAVGHTELSKRGRWMAAVLACGPCAALSHHKAGALWGLRPSSSPKIDVTVPNTNGRRREGVRIHRSRALGADEVTAEDGIPATTPERTILDLAASLSVAHLEKVLDRMEILELAEYRTLAQLARTRTGHRGAAKLLATLDTYLAGEQPTRSDLEVLFRQLCHDHGLPQPRVNQHVAGKEVDFLFADHRLIVEADSWRYHKTRRAFESDRTRDVITAQAGFRTVRFTDRRLANDPAGVATALRTLLGCAAPSSSLSPRPSRSLR